MSNGGKNEDRSRVSWRQDKHKDGGWGIPLDAASNPARRRSLLKVGLHICFSPEVVLGRMQLCTGLFFA